MAQLMRVKRNLADMFAAPIYTATILHQLMTRRISELNGLLGHRKRNSLEKYLAEEIGDGYISFSLS
jgi:hypothetical protein